MAVLRAAQLFPQSPIREISVRAPTRWPVWGTHRWLQYIVNRTSSAVDVSNAEPCALNAARYNPSGCAGSLTPNKKLHRIKGPALRWPFFCWQVKGRRRSPFPLQCELLFREIHNRRGFGAFCRNCLAVATHTYANIACCAILFAIQTTRIITVTQFHYSA